jgi:type I restriction enzyme, S subunit
VAVTAEYQQSEIGPIPKDWSVTTVGDEFSIQLGKMLDAEKNTGIPKPFLGNRAVQWGRIDLTDIGEVKLTPTDLQRFRLRYGDLLVCEGGEVGRAAIWGEPIAECYYQKALHRLRPKRGYNISLMLSVLQRLASTGFLLNFVTQTSIAHLPKDKLEAVPIPLPSPAEQDAIAEALSDADALVESLERLIAKKRYIKQGAMHDLLTGEKRLPGFVNEWARLSLGELFTFKNGLNKSKEFFGHGTPIVNYMDVFRGPRIKSADIAGRVSLTPNELATFDVRRGDVFFTRTSETSEEIGMASVVMDEPQQTAFSGFVLRGRPKDRRLLDSFKAYCLRSDDLRAQIISKASYTTRALTNGRVLSAVVLPVPGSDEQAAIAAVLGDMDAEIDALEAKRAKSRQIKQGMMQELLTCRVRLV